MRSASLKLEKCSFFRGGLKEHAGKHEKEEGDMKCVSVCVCLKNSKRKFVCV